MIDNNLLLEKINIRAMTDLLELIEFTDMSNDKEKEEAVKEALSQLKKHMEDENDKLKLFISFFVILLFNIEAERYPLISSVYKEATVGVPEIKGMTNNIERVLDYFDLSKKKKKLDPELSLFVNSIESHRKVVALQKMKDH
jgi:hypothetical protein